MPDWLTEWLPLITSAVALIVAIAAIISSFAAWRNAGSTKTLAGSAEKTEPFIERQAKALENAVSTAKDSAESAKTAVNQLETLNKTQKNLLNLYEELRALEHIPFINLSFRTFVSDLTNLLGHLEFENFGEGLAIMKSLIVEEVDLSYLLNNEPLRQGPVGRPEKISLATCISRRNSYPPSALVPLNSNNEVTLELMYEDLVGRQYKSVLKLVKTGIDWLSIMHAPIEFIRL